MLTKIIAHPQVQSFGLKLIVALGILLATWIINKLIQASLSAIEKKSDVPTELFYLIRKIIKFVIYIIGIITALEHMDAKVDTILTSLGVGGLAIGFALKDSLTNIISGVIIIAYRPFSIGDYIKIQLVSGHFDEGKVVGINFRYVTMEANNDRTIIPNYTIVSTPVIVSKSQIK